MSAIRAARGFTKRDYIVKFEGCYHGHADHLLVKAGSGLATFGAPDSGGVPEGIAKTTLTLRFNDGAGVLGVDRERLPRARRGLHLRRGDDRLPAGARRRARALRHPPRHDHARE